jgi:lysophospholipase L1-like esterase
MARRNATTRTARFACRAGVALLSALIAGAALAQSAPPTAPPQTAAPPDGAQTPMSKACQPGATAMAGESPLPNVAAALAQRKTLRILALGAAPGRVGSSGGYTRMIEAMLARALKGIDVVVINRGVSGELAASAATRMKNEVALDEPDLVLWQVGTNDALAYVPAAEFAATLKDQIDWLKAHKVDVVLVGLQFAKEMLRDAHYVEIRETLRKLAAQQNVIVIRFFEAMQIINQIGAVQPAAEDFERNEAGYNCLAQYVARAIALGVFAKNMPKRPAP